MEKDIGKIKKNDNTDIIVRLDDFGGNIGLTVREFTTTERYTGFTKSGTRIPLECIKEFKNIINKINEDEINKMQNSILKNVISEEKEDAQKKLNVGENSDSEKDNSSEENKNNDYVY